MIGPVAIHEPPDEASDEADDQDGDDQEEEVEPHRWFAPG